MSKKVRARTMVQSIDHVVIVVRDLTQTMADYHEAGFTVTPGGEHADGMTHNALITFADGSYLELIAFNDPDQPHAHQWWPHLARGEGFVDFALLSDDIERDAARWRSQGLSVYGPRDGGRRRPDGQELRWRTVTLHDGVKTTPLPFIIQDVTPRALRVPDGSATQHTLPVTGLRGVTLAVRDLAGHSAELGKLLGNAPTDTNAVRHRYALGSQWIDLVAADATEDLAAATQTFGETPYALALATTDNRASILPELAHGARIALID